MNRLLVFATALAVLLAMALPAAAERPLVTITEVLGGMSHVAEQDGCRIEWVVHLTEHSLGQIGQRARCEMALSERGPLLRALAVSVLDKHGPDAMSSLFWGRLAASSGDDAGLSRRLAMQALGDESWTGDSCRPEAPFTHVNEWTVQALRRAGVGDDVSALLEEIGVSARVSSVEKVLCYRSAQLPFAVELKAAGASPDTVLPFDCQLWLSLDVSAYVSSNTN